MGPEPVIAVIVAHHQGAGGNDQTYPPKLFPQLHAALQRVGSGAGTFVAIGGTRTPVFANKLLKLFGLGLTGAVLTAGFFLITHVLKSTRSALTRGRFPVCHHQNLCLPAVLELSSAGQVTVVLG